MPRGILSIVFVLTLGGLTALLMCQGFYESHVVNGDTVVVVNRFTGKSFQIRRGLRESVADSTLENRVSKLFEQAFEKGQTPLNSAPSRTDARQPARDLDDPYGGMYANPFFMVLTEPDQFEYLKRWTDDWIRPFEDRSLLISKESRDKTYDVLIQGLSKHPHFHTLSEKEKEEIRTFYRLRVYGK